jgi:8-oxo-dGTP pyrophosphatase MutT (NUDIX family)
MGERRAKAVDRIDYLEDPLPPRPNALVPATSAIVANKDGMIVLHRRRDNDLWDLPGGAMEVGESTAVCVVREVKEETGLDVAIRSVVGIYLNPHHVIAFADGEVRQEFSICFACDLIGGELSVSDESHEVAYFEPAQIEQLPMHPSVRQRICDHLAHSAQLFITLMGSGMQCCLSR